MTARSRLALAVLASLAPPAARDARAAAAQFMDYITPTPIVGSLSKTCWGAAQVGARDQSNGLEDRTLSNWNYWDGGIIKDEQTGVYHMFASRWKQSDGHGGWQNDSHCVHATSNSLFGPYTDQGLCFPNDNGGMCHNVNALKLKTGDASGKQYAITCSGGVAGSGRAYGAASLDGPWTYLGNLQLDPNGYSGEYSTADNFREMLRADGQQYECINSRLGVADNLLGPYKDQLANNFTSTVSGSPTVNMEDPFLFYAGGVYHVMFHQWSSGQAFLYTSQDGIHGWKLDPGVAYDPATNMVRYTDGTVNHWPIMERASVYVENGHAVALTFAVLNVQKADDHGNDGNGSKIIVVPFNGRAYDCDHFNVGCDAGNDGGTAMDGGRGSDAGTAATGGRGGGAGAGGRGGGGAGAGGRGTAGASG
ncbi:MAG TPA: glycoside hydrolase family protein, partial [Polyangia bacterium]|nr:glycoside hydrolase family protein [Polyangia bacterium]